MKKLIIVPFLLLSLGMISCKKEPVPEQQLYMQQKEMLIINPGLLLFGKCDSWYVSLLQVNKTDITGSYKSVNLTFCPGNTFVISNDIVAITGSWHFTYEEGNPATFILDLNYPSDIPSEERPSNLWVELNGEWKIERLQKNMISLQMDNQEKRLIIERGAIY